MYNDAFELELHNLNEVNEYFRIFKDEILKKDQENSNQIKELKLQVTQLRNKIYSHNEKSIYNKSKDQESTDQENISIINVELENEVRDVMKSKKNTLISIPKPSYNKNQKNFGISNISQGQIANHHQIDSATFQHNYSNDYLLRSNQNIQNSYFNEKNNRVMTSNLNGDLLPQQR